MGWLLVGCSHQAMHKLHCLGLCIQVERGVVLGWNFILC